MARRIACIVDKEGRIQHRRMLYISSFLKNCDIFTLANRKQIDWNKYNLVYYSNYSLLQRVPNSVQKICSITSHKSTKNFKKSLKVLKNFIGVSVNNTLLFDFWKKHITNIHYTPNGVDTTMFYPDSLLPKSPVTIGWVGNSDRATKNFNIVSALKAELPVKFDILVTSKKDTILPVLPDDMRSYYKKLTYFLVTSSTEGTPNPALEAMACGIPIITTRVGNMIEIIKEGYNGFFIEDNVIDAKNKINEILKMPIECIEVLSNNARQSIIPWDWNIKRAAWIDFFKRFIK